MQAGLAPGQIREGLRCSNIVFTHVETFLTMIAHHAFFLEPLTYVSAWIFEERGFAYSKGHQLIDIIHKEFQPGNELHKALDGSTPFRQPDQWKTVRGRAGAITVRILIPWPETFIWISLAVTLWFPTWSAVTFLPKVKKSR